MGPLFLFAMPRSGSTLFMRLINRCRDGNGHAVMMAGESKTLFEHIQTMCGTMQVSIAAGGKDGNVSYNPYYTLCIPENVSRIAQAAMESFYNPEAAATWGCKNILYGRGYWEKFYSLLSFFRSLYPQCRFIFHQRCIDDVKRSIRRLHAVGWWHESLWTLHRYLKKQQRNFARAASQFSDAVQSDYTNLLHYGTFSAIVNLLGLTITETDYNEELSRKLGSKESIAAEVAYQAKIIGLQ